MSTKEEKKKGTKKNGSARPSLAKGLGTGLGKLWIFFILVIVLCVNISYLVRIRICPPSYYFERVYSVSGADSLASSFERTMDEGGLRQGMLERITPNYGTLPARLTLQSGEDADTLKILVTADNYYNAKEIMELFCVMYPEYAGSDWNLLSETESGEDILLPFLIRTVEIGALPGAVVCLIWLFCYAVSYRKSYAQTVSHRHSHRETPKQPRAESSKQPQADSDRKASAAGNPARKKQNSLKCLLELPKMPLREGGESAARQLLITSKYADEDFKKMISGFCGSVQQRMDDRGSTILLVTSSVAGEGKSVIAANLALSLSEAGNSVVLVEANFGDTQYPLTAEGPGLLDYAGDRARLEDILHLSGDNLGLITPGSSNEEQDRTELLASFKIRNLLEKLADTMDYVILDTAPLVEAPETSVLLEQTDDILYVTRADQDNQENLRAGLEILLAGKGNMVLGFVMNYSQEEA